MKKTYLFTLGIVCLIIVSCAVANIQGEQIYKNLKVLPKDITKVQMDSVMNHFTVSMNVKCNFCHTRNSETNEFDFPADGNKHKLIARDMIRMTNNINKEYFNITGAKQTLNTPLMVTCYTCHQGKTDPLVKPPKK